MTWEPLKPLPEFFGPVARGQRMARVGQPERIVRVGQIALIGRKALGAGRKARPALDSRPRDRGWRY